MEPVLKWRNVRGHNPLVSALQLAQIASFPVSTRNGGAGTRVQAHPLFASTVSRFGRKENSKSEISKAWVGVHKTRKPVSCL